MFQTLRSPRYAFAARSLPSQVLRRKHFDRPISTVVPLSHERLHEVLPPMESFSRRHIGPSPEETGAMLEECGVEVCRVVPELMLSLFLH